MYICIKLIKSGLLVIRGLDIPVFIQSVFIQEILFKKYSVDLSITFVAEAQQRIKQIKIFVPLEYTW